MRHDGGAWQPSDAYRKRLSGKELGFQGALVTVRGDWAAFTTTFGLPGWGEARGCCWRCRCTPPHASDARREAAWRGTTLSPADLLLRNMAAGVEPSPLLSAPLVRDLSVFRVDWLHCVDQGVALDWFGSSGFFSATPNTILGRAGRHVWTPCGIPSHLITIGLVCRIACISLLCR